MMPFCVLEMPSPEVIYAKDTHRASGPVTMGGFCHSFPVIHEGMRDTNRDAGESKILFGSAQYVYLYS